MARLLSQLAVGETVTIQETGGGHSIAGQLSANPI